MLSSSSNIQILSNAILKAAKSLRRDYGELEKLQNSRSNVINFVENAYQNTRDLISSELKNARPDWNFFFKKMRKVNWNYQIKRRKVLFD